ncbi:MAG: hypothetical protein IT315_07270 [Anaerolineales bacterium]|nr:hypothetical protein [Anaerolineales bacterium]
MSNQNSIYAFFARAEDRAVDMMIDTSSEEKWMSSVRRAVGIPDAEIHLVHEGEWNAPVVKSVEQNPNTFIKGIQDYFLSQNLPPMSKADFSRKHLGDLKSAVTGLVVALIKHPN